MALILDHVNGVPTDNRLENLRILCPNCAATLDTHCGRKNRQPPHEAECARCGVTFHQRYPRQRYRSRSCGQRWDRHGVPQVSRRKVTRPPYEELMADIKATGYSAMGRRYGVSGTAIRKWVEQYARERDAAFISGDAQRHRQAEAAPEQGHYARSSLPSIPRTCAGQRVVIDAEEELAPVGARAQVGHRERVASTPDGDEGLGAHSSWSADRSADPRARLDWCLWPGSGRSTFAACVRDSSGS